MGWTKIFLGVCVPDVRTQWSSTLTAAGQARLVYNTGANKDTNSASVL